MNRFLILLLILLWALAYSWFWNCNRRPYCYSGVAADVEGHILADSSTKATINADTAVYTEEEKILFQPIDVYFASGKSGIVRTPKIDTFLLTAKKYLAEHPDKVLILTGYTDGDGSEETNQQLSLARANEVKSLLVNDGIKAVQMITEGKGKKDAIATNDTEAGKAKNRRVSIRLKEGTSHVKPL
ncbi:OmpA family protein [Emticicia sp. 17c]|uniref:OmpA family protein n=1 Tax=Emticicia sp. 17c TaxID=3127704 RepID=UPI00301DF53A